MSRPIPHPVGGRKFDCHHLRFDPAGVQPWPGGVAVWHCAHECIGAELAARTLTSDEHSRAARYRSPEAARQFAASRTALRLILSAQLGCGAGDVPLGVRPDGKPELVGANPRGWQFNVSHTAGLTLVAVAAVPVGVDVERARPIANLAALVERYFAPQERAEFAALPDELKPTAFFRGWTHKEAILKGIGCGTRDLNRAQVRLDPRTPPLVLADAESARDWHLVEWHAADGYPAALAVRAGA